MSKILAITGATGKKSGGYFMQVLCQHTNEISVMFDGGIRAVVRESCDTSALDSAPLHIDKCVGSADDFEFMKGVFDGVDTVVHIAGIHCSKEVASAAACCGVRRLIMVHTTGIYSKYKKAGEEYRKIDDIVYQTCKEADIILTILRPTMIYGRVNDNNIITFIRIIDKSPFMPVVNGARYDLQPVNYKDLGIAYYEVLIHEATTSGRDFNLSGGAPIQLREMLTVIGNLLGKKVRFINVPLFAAYSGAWVIYLLSFGKKDYREKVQRLCEPRIFLHNDATEAFGYHPMTFEEGIVDEIKSYIEGNG